jgi:site-specific DNA recombinase
MGGRRPLRAGHKSDSLDDQCTGHAPLTVGRTTRCPAKLGRAARLETVVWHALRQLLRTPRVLPHRHQTWANAKPQTLSGLEAQHAPWVPRRQRLERQDERVLDAYQAEMMTRSALQARRPKLAAAVQQIEQERRHLVHTRHQSIHWPQGIDHAATLRQWRGDHLEQLSFGARQAIPRCLISNVVVTGEEVDGHFVLPCDSPPQMARHLPPESEGTPGHFYRLRLAHFQVPFIAQPGASMP